MTWVSPRELLISFDKANPYHDPHDGKFTTSDGVGGGGSGADPIGATARYRQTVGSRSASALAASSLPDGKRFTNHPPMSDQEHADHIAYVEKQLTLHGGDAASLAHSPDSTHISQDYVSGVEGHYNDHRRSLQNQIRNEYAEQAQSVPSERRSIIMGGLMGAGKSTMLRVNAKSPDSIAARLGIKFKGYDEKGNGIGAPANFVVLSPDDISDRMEEMGMAPKIDHLSPAESATFIHEEASSISKDIATDMIHQGKNVIWDISLKDVGAGHKKLRQLNAEGYHTAGVFVDVSVAQSLKGAAFRHRQGQDLYNAGIGMGGRYTPSSLMKNAADPSGRYRSRNRAAFEELKSQGAFDQTMTVDNENFAQRLIEQTGSAGTGHEPRPASTRDRNGRKLEVGDRVSHVASGRDGPQPEGVVEHLPLHGDDPLGDRVGVYWYIPGAGAIRDSHSARQLVQLAPDADRYGGVHQGAQSARWSYAIHRPDQRSVA